MYKLKIVFLSSYKITVDASEKTAEILSYCPQGLKIIFGRKIKKGILLLFLQIIVCCHFM